jgi:nicotinate-nucleotide adenylyltransferase
LSAPVAVFGGTFDPVHFGLLRCAEALLERLSLAELRFMPAADPPHREAPVASARHRAAMLALAVADNPALRVDTRELRRSGPSYTVLSLRELRAELGDAQPLCFVLGADALLGLASWYEWTTLTDYAHLVAIARPGWHWPREGVVAEFLAARACAGGELQNAAAGRVCVLELPPQPYSATEVRALLQSGASARDMVPAAVLAYIEAHGLYAPATAPATAPVKTGVSEGDPRAQRFPEQE